MKLDGKIAMVTGAASGIGKEIAHTFAREGGQVVIADLNLGQAQAAAEETGKAGPEATGVATGGHFVKCQFGYRRARYRGIAKNGAQVFALLALANLYISSAAGLRLRDGQERLDAGKSVTFRCRRAPPRPIDP